jgi:hypothetical protein
MKIIYKCLCFLIITGSGCNSDEKQIFYDLIIKDALHQAVSKEYLPEVEPLLNLDTIFIITYNREISPREERFVYNKELEYYLPTYIGKWRLMPIDSTFLKNHNKLNYLSIALSEMKGNLRVDIIRESIVSSDIISIDRGRLVIIYGKYLGYPQIKDLWYFWG